MMKCGACEIPATARHIYGVYELAGVPRSKLGIPMNEICLCNNHGQELWDRISGSVSMGYTHYQVLPVK